MGGQAPISANEALYEHDAWQMDFDECWDCRTVDNFAVVIEEVRQLAEMETETQGNPPTGRVIIAPHDVVAADVVAPKRLATGRLKL